MAGDGCGNYYVLTASGEVGFVDTMADADSTEGEHFADLFTCIESLLANDQATSQ